MTFDFDARDRGEGATNSCVKKFEIFVNLCACADCRAWVARVDFLLNRDSRRQPGNQIANVARRYDANMAISNSFGFGGQNGCVALRICND